MKNFKKLSREELKNTFGGLRACKLVIQGSDGSWITRTGTCSTAVDMNYINGTPYPTTHSYCDAGLGDVPLSSNGGNSNC